jgi:hypothetical protein
MSQASLGKGRIIGDVTTPTDGDTIISYLTDAAGNVLTSTLVGSDQALDVNIVQMTGQYLEDDPHNSGDIGNFMLAVRNDGGTALAGTDLDYIPLSTDAAGSLRVAVSSFTSNYEYAEDTGHTTADVGAFVLSVLRNSPTAEADTNGDYAPFSVDPLTHLRVTDKSDTAILQQRVSVANTATSIPATALANRKHIMVQNDGNASVFLGSATVTTSGATTGIEMAKGGVFEADIGDDIDLNGIVASGTNDVLILEMS